MIRKQTVVDLISTPKEVYYEVWDWFCQSIHGNDSFSYYRIEDYAPEEHPIFNEWLRSNEVKDDEDVIVLISW